MTKSWGFKGRKSLLLGTLAAIGLAGTLAIGCDDDNEPSITTGSGGRGGSTGGGNTGIGGSGGSAAGSTGAGGSAGASAVGGASGATATLNDGRIVGVMIEANSGEVHAAELAKSKSSNSAVLSFADMMIADHTAATMRLQQLLDTKGMVADDSAQRQTMSTQATQTMNTLWATPAATFDVVYMDSQVSMHTMVLQMLDNMMIPSSQDADLKTELQSTRTAVAAHLAHAQQVRAALP